MSKRKADNDDLHGQPKMKRQRPESFKIEFPGGDSIKKSIIDHIQTIKSQMNAAFQKCHNNTGQMFMVHRISAHITAPHGQFVKGSFAFVKISSLMSNRM